VTGKIISDTDLVSELGVNGVVAKPFTEEQLLSVIEKALLAHKAGV
jgi:CheY-like chemotaxis protein